MTDNLASTLRRNALRARAHIALRRALPSCPLSPATRARHSAALNAIRSFDLELATGAEDIRAWGAPGECMGLVARAAERRLDATLDALGFRTEAERRSIERLTRQRTTGKVAWLLGA